MFELIKKFEGFAEHAYECPAGVVTIGYGTTFYPDGTLVKMGDTITQKQAEDCLMWYCTNRIKLPRGMFTENQKEALYSVIYNIGQGAFDKSNCKKAIEAENWKLAYKEWNWVKANGKVLNGLIKRRQAEKELFFEGLNI